MSNSHGFQDESPSNDNKTIAISNFLEYNLLISQWLIDKKMLILSKPNFD